MLFRRWAQQFVAWYDAQSSRFHDRFSKRVVDLVRDILRAQAEESERCSEDHKYAHHWRIPVDAMEGVFASEEDPIIHGGLEFMIADHEQRIEARPARAKSLQEKKR